MRLGYWTPIYGGFLRNVGDEGMPATWDYVRHVSQLADRLGYDITLVPELYLNDRKGIDAPSLEAWELAAAIAAVTEQVEIMVAVRPGFHLPAVAAKRAATLDEISGGRIALNVVSAWWQEEARQYGGTFGVHDERYVRTEEWVDVVDGLWRRTPFTYVGDHYEVHDAVLSPKPRRRPTLWAGGESDGGKASIARFADSYVMHGGTVDEIRTKTAEMRRRREQLGREPFAEFGMAAYVIVRDTEAEAAAELERITAAPGAGSPGYASYQEFVQHSQLETAVSLREYSVGTRGLRPDLVGTAEQVAEKLHAYAEAGLDLVLIQSSPLDTELERIAEQVFPLVRGAAAAQAPRGTAVAAGV
ncbi:LLM class flavin-dependent oxidoreductase [Cellulomonas fimi]|uniref:LLM class flavin-dependent oxidoreductase n=1 Tax=Cellulomonas fimi TaxID=1708 RepID=A0A7Y0LZX3_CELFI|nr:LLM class flavin-dependent oxidoreductase [Cellulomonas fimi]NMR20503.1 LLM class flavin-dependent oxidoreductase [Cellulomonas fimi]